MYLSERATKKARQMLLKKAIVTFCAILLLATVLALFSHSAFAVANFRITGDFITDEALLRNTVAKTVNKNFLFFWRRDNVLFFPIKKTKAALANDFPRVKEIKIKPKKLNLIEIEIKERLGDYLWCRDEENCFLLDPNGFVYAAAPYLSGSAFLRFYGGGELSIGQNFLTPSEFSRLLSFREKLEILGLESRKIFIKDESYELWLASGGFIILSPQNDFEKAFANLASAVIASPLDKKLKEELGSLEYLDLRFDDRVVYKFK